jgi:predicted nucleic acid-binding protein
MRVECVVINASPLITLFRAGLHPLLPKLFPDLVVPDAVWAEVVNHTHDDPATRGLPGADWARKLATPISQDIMEWGLGEGETAVLSYAQNNRN